MSWSRSVKIENHDSMDEVEDQLRAAETVEGQAPPDEGQFNAAVEAAVMLIDCMGGDSFNVSLSGHKGGSSPTDKSSINVSVSEF